MQVVIVLEDGQLARDGTTERESRAARVIRLLLEKKYQVVLFDGRAVRHCQLLDPRFADSRPIMEWKRLPDVGDLVKWIKDKYKGSGTLGLVFDLQFGRNMNYGARVYLDLRNDQSFRVNINPVVVYSKHVDEDKRGELVGQLGINGDQILCSNTDPAEQVVGFF